MNIMIIQFEVYCAILCRLYSGILNHGKLFSSFYMELGIRMKRKLLVFCEII